MFTVFFRYWSHKNRCRQCATKSTAFQLESVYTSITCTFMCSRNECNERVYDKPHLLQKLSKDQSRHKRGHEDNKTGPSRAPNEMNKAQIKWAIVVTPPFLKRPQFYPLSPPLPARLWPRSIKICIFFIVEGYAVCVLYYKS